MPGQSCKWRWRSGCGQSVEDGEGWLESRNQNRAIEVAAVMSAKCIWKARVARCAQTLSRKFYSRLQEPMP